MKKKKLVKLLSAGLIAATMLAPVQASAATYNGAPTYEQNNSYYNQTIKVQDIEFGRAVVYIHDGNNIFGAPYGVYPYTAHVVVDNRTYDKTIVMHQQTASGTWKDSAKGTYVKSLGNGKELWEIKGWIDGNAQFCFNYKEVNAWDNNNTNNYTPSDFR